MTTNRNKTPADKPADTRRADEATASASNASRETESAGRRRGLNSETVDRAGRGTADESSDRAASDTADESSDRAASDTADESGGEFNDRSYSSAGPIRVELTPEQEIENKVALVTYTAASIANALLQNPQIERFLAGPPLDAGKVDSVSRGRYLARRTFAFALDFDDELDALKAIEIANRRAELAKAETTAGEK